MTYFQDFTEDAYRKLIQRVKRTYKFDYFTNFDSVREYPTVLWRHDIDMSPHRAARIAEIEYEEDVSSTYFLHLHSAFYNLFEENVVEQINKIIDVGHPLGLHYDIAFYQKPSKYFAPFDLIEEERDLIWDVFGRKPMAISFHNPSFLNIDIPVCYKIDSMVNASSAFIRKNYKYCSDSNGVWGYSNLETILNENHQRLHVLTHPEWWTPEPMHPMEKVARCINGRRDYMERYYSSILARVYK